MLQNDVKCFKLLQIAFKAIRSECLEVLRK